MLDLLTIGRSIIKYMHAVLILIFLFSGFSIYAHEGHHHGTQTHEAKTNAAEDSERLTFESIEVQYKQTVEPIFSVKCAACHSEQAEMPWYAQIPGIRQIIERDRAEAKEHLEISNGFPFGGHGNSVEDLKAIKDVTENGSMPTTFYRFMHPSSNLSQSEKETILNWVALSSEKISKNIPQEKH